MIISNDLLTEIAHISILIGVVMSYAKAKKVEDLLDIQKDTIEALKVGLAACKDSLKNITESKASNHNNDAG